MGKKSNRDRKFQLRLNEEEWERLGQVADYMGCSRSEVLRQVIDSGALWVSLVMDGEPRPRRSRSVIRRLWNGKLPPV